MRIREDHEPAPAERNNLPPLPGENVQQGNQRDRAPEQRIAADIMMPPLLHQAQLLPPIGNFFAPVGVAGQPASLMPGKTNGGTTNSKYICILILAL